ncbi:hypothetical protein GLOIN_2v1589720 [Rhizophagus irregularis DAOM 181602=DAOM 197198]|nr:hypothetical protein GLOIN_2v1589720 [Rhizophagus irregularis DAOM 181602=DAOM 197198]
MNVERKSAKIDSYTDSRNNDKKAGYMKCSPAWFCAQIKAEGEEIYLTPVAHETFTEWKKNRKVKLEAEEDLLKRQLSKLNKDYDDDDYDHDILDLSGRRRTRRGTKTEQVLHEQSDEANKENIAENPYEGGNSNNTSK